MYAVRNEEIFELRMIFAWGIKIDVLRSGCCCGSFDRGGVLFHVFFNAEFPDVVLALEYRRGDDLLPGGIGVDGGTEDDLRLRKLFFQQREQSGIMLLPLFRGDKGGFITAF